MKAAYCEETSHGNFDFRIPIGTKKVLVDKRPGWKEDMVNSFEIGGRICPYATSALTYKYVKSEPRRRAEL